MTLNRGFMSDPDRSDARRYEVIVRSGRAVVTVGVYETREQAEQAENDARQINVGAQVEIRERPL